MLNVLDLHGRPIHNLQPADLRVSINHKQVDVARATYLVQPRRIVIVLDTSGSMAGSRAGRKWAVARQAAEDVLSIASPEIPIAMVTFSTDVVKTFEFATDRDQLRQWLRDTKREDLRGTTGLLDAVMAATHVLQPPEEGDAIYAISDGQDTHSRISADRLRLTLLRQGVRLFMFKLADRGPESEVETTKNLQDVAVATGGFIFGRSALSPISWEGGEEYDFNSRVQETIQLQTTVLIFQISGFYRVEVNAKVPFRDDSRVSLEVVDARGKRRKDITATYQRYLSACSSLSPASDNAPSR